MINWILDIYNSVLGNPIVEPALMVYVSFFIIFIVMPILVLYAGVKLAALIIRTISEWWHDGAK